MVPKRALHIDQIKEAIAAQNAARIEEAFNTMPNEDQVGGLTPENAMMFLDTVAEMLKSNQGPMPRRRCETLRIAYRSSYANGATAVYENRGYGRIILRPGSNEVGGVCRWKLWKARPR